MLKPEEVRLSKSEAAALLADLDGFIARHGLTVEVGLYYESNEDENPTSHYLSGNLLNLALHLRDDVAAARLLDSSTGGLPLSPRITVVAMRSTTLRSTCTLLNPRPISG